MPSIPRDAHAAPVPPTWKRVYWIGGAFVAGLFACVMCMGLGIAGWWFGAGRNSGAPKDNAAKQDKTAIPSQIEWLPLTQAERSRWDRVRRQVRAKFESAVKRGDGLDEFFMVGDQTEADRKASLEKLKKAQEANIEKASGRRFQYFAYSMKAKAWFAPSLRTNDLLQRNPVFVVGLPKDIFTPAQHLSTYLMDDSETAKKQAELIASLPDVRCVAQVDLYSKDNPVIALWVHDAGTGAVTGAALPFPDLSQELKAFVYQLQTTAE